MTKFEEYCEVRLREWAHWYMSGSDFGLGFPKETIEYRLYHEGVIIKSNNGGAKVLKSNVEAEEVEKNVVALKKIKGDLHAKLLREWYFRDKRTPKEAIATRLSLSLTKAEYMLKDCRTFILSRITSTWS